MPLLNLDPLTTICIGIAAWKTSGLSFLSTTLATLIICLLNISKYRRLRQHFLFFYFLCCYEPHAACKEGVEVFLQTQKISFQRTNCKLEILLQPPALSLLSRSASAFITKVRAKLALY